MHDYLLCKEDSGLRPMFVGMLERRGINAMNERKHPEAGVFTGCILWPTDPVARCSAAVVPALQHCSQLLHQAAAANLLMMLLSTMLQWNVWHDSFYVLLLQQQNQQSLQVTLLTISISCRAAAWYLQWAQLLQAPAAVCSQLLSPVLLSNWVRRGRGGELHLLLSSSGPSHHNI